jgi:hypothetical protein
MSISVPIRLKIEQAGVLKGYVETLDFTGITVSVAGPIATVTGAPAGGGNAATLEGHPASYFGTAAEDVSLSAQITSIHITDAAQQAQITSNATALAALLNRALMWASMGVAVQPVAPATGITYAQWLSGIPGSWGWIQIP